MRGLRTGEVIDKRWLRFAFPTTWHSDVLRGLDYLRRAGAQPDGRVAEAVQVVLDRRHQNGRWPLNRTHAVHLPFALEPGIGLPSWWEQPEGPAGAAMGWAMGAPWGVSDGGCIEQAAYVARAPHCSAQSHTPLRIARLGGGSGGFSAQKREETQRYMATWGRTAN